jgi:hypothetical protein
MLFPSSAIALLAVGAVPSFAIPAQVFGDLRARIQIVEVDALDARNPYSLVERQDKKNGAAVTVRLCGYMWRSDVVEVLGGSRESHDVHRFIHQIIVNQAYACATTNSTVPEPAPQPWQFPCACAMWRKPAGFKTLA